ncbi:MAG: mycofactocin precursor [Streptosporangiales bacterium]|nr:mycofactocin precursor [Streptosporangiales bacterium]
MVATPEREAEAPAGREESTEVLDDLLVEEVSIDGMCGVY